MLERLQRTHPAFQTSLTKVTGRLLADLGVVFLEYR